MRLFERVVKDNKYKREFPELFPAVNTIWTTPFHGRKGSRRTEEIGGTGCHSPSEDVHLLVHTNCSSTKPNGKVRLCIDFTKLTESVRQENCPLPTTDQLLAQLDGATAFTKLDCNSGFHQIPLHPECQVLSTFITIFGRYCYKRLPFGISSGPESFHREMTCILEGIPGVICDTMVD